MAELLAHLVGTVAVDDMDLFGFQQARGAVDAGQHRLAANGVQHLGQRRLHPCALAGGQDDHFQCLIHLLACS
jgi:hypothetical protein